MYALKSLRGKIIFWMLFFLIPVFLLFLICSMAITRSYERQMDASIHQLLRPFAAEIDGILNGAMRFLANQNISLSVMDEPVVNRQLEHMDELNILGDSISKSLAEYNSIDAFFLYKDKKIWFVNNRSSSYKLNHSAADYLEEYLPALSSNSALFQQGYQFFETDGNSYLFLALNVPEGVIGCWFLTDTLLNSLTSSPPDGLYEVSLVPSGTSVYDNKNDHSYVTEVSLPSYPYTITALWDRDIIFRSFYNLLHLMILSLCIIFLLFLLYLLSIHRSVIRPLKYLVTVIQGMEHSPLSEVPLNKKNPLEVQKVFLALNTLISKICNLKIQVYEEKLEKKNVELQLYQLQLRPHFILNVLNHIISFAHINETSKIQRMALFLSEHCRYILYHRGFVTLDEELSYTKSYLSIRSLQMEMEISFKTDAEDAVLDLPVPILSVQLFVENALKHSQKEISQLKLSVHAFLDSEKPGYLHLSILDNGIGFPPEKLEMPGTPSFQKGHGIGLYNISRRLNLLYGGDAFLHFSNPTDGGAFVELILPVDTQKGGIP